MSQETTLENLTTHLASIDKTEWHKLSRLIPEIESTESFGDMKISEKMEDGLMAFPYIVPSKVVDDFYQTVFELGIVPVFDWINWQNGKDLLDNNETNYSELDIVTLCKLFTIILRVDRFNEGYLVTCFEKGIILKILKGIKYWITKSTD